MVDSQGRAREGVDQGLAERVEIMLITPTARPVDHGWCDIARLEQFRARQPDATDS